jgi:AraC-like DNA-binding protein
VACDVPPRGIVERRSTDFQAAADAANSGFVYQQQMSRVFRSRLGASPAAYRAAHRQR